MTRAFVALEPRPLTPAPRGLLQRRCACGGTPGPDGECAECKRKRLQRLARGSASASPTPLVDEVLRSAGRPIDAATRGLMEARFAPYSGLAAARPALAASRPVSVPGDRFEREAEHVAADVTGNRPSPAGGGGADFSRVRIHTDDRAAASARSVDAHAYTVGSHIVFDRGRYAPTTPAGQRLLAHELAHVVQQGDGPPGPILREPNCVHDGRPARCGYAWRLTPVPATGEFEGVAEPTGMFEDPTKAIGVDRIIVDSLGRNLSGTWVSEITSPLNVLKDASESGRVDGLKVIENGGELRLEVVEVKSCARGPKAGCVVASREAGEYVRVFRRIADRIVLISRAAEQLGGLRVTASALGPGRTRVLRSLGIDPADPDTQDALRFWFSLQTKLGTTYTKAFDNVAFAVNKDGTKGVNYSAIKVRRDCVTQRGVEEGTVELFFQVNKVGGISYRCETKCPDDEESKRKRPQPEKRQEKPKSRRRRTDVQEPSGDQPELPDQPPVDVPTPDRPDDRPVDRPEIRDQPPAKPEITKQPPAKPEITKQPPAKPDVTKKPPTQDAPVAQPGGNLQGVPELIMTLTALHQWLKAARAARAAGAITAVDLAVVESQVTKASIEVIEEIGTAAPEVAKTLNGRNLAKYGTEAGDEVLKAGATEFDELALRTASRTGGTALKTLGRVTIVLAIVLTAADVHAMVSHIRKGGDIRIGLGGPEAELSGETKITKHGEDPFNKPKISGSGRLKDTIIDIDVSGMPNLSGKTQIDAENVTIRQAGVLTNGEPITVNIHAKLKNTTITITHRARFQDGKAVIGGEAVDISDTNIEIDLPPDVTLPERKRKPGEPISLKGVKMKVTEVPAQAPTGPTGEGGAGAQPGTQPAPPKTEQKPAEKPRQPADPAAKYKDLDEPTRQKIREASKPVQALFDELTKPDPKTKGVPVTNETVKRFFETVPADLTEAQLDVLRKRMVAVTTDDPDAWFQALSDAVAAARKPADDALKKEGEASKDKPAVSGEPEKDKPDEEKVAMSPAEIFEQYKKSYERIRPGGWVIDWSAAEKAADKRRKKGEKVKPERDAVYLGKTNDGVKLFAPVRVRMISREKKRGTLKILSVGNVIDETGASHARPPVLTGDTVSGRIGW